MTHTDAAIRRDPYVLARDEGRHFHFLGHLATVKVAGAESSLSTVEFMAPHGFGPPLHRHDLEDELFIVLEGELVYRSGDQEFSGGPGSIAHLPRGVPHGFQVVSDMARFVNVTAAVEGPPRFDAMVAQGALDEVRAMVAALGDEAAVPSVPDPGPIDPNRVAEVCRAHGIEILGPPPPPLDQTDDMRRSS